MMSVNHVQSRVSRHCLANAGSHLQGASASNRMLTVVHFMATDVVNKHFLNVTYGTFNIVL